MKKVAISIPMMIIALGSGANAQGFAGMRNDPTLMQTLDMMLSTLGYACQMGDSASCQNHDYVMGNANAMMGASDACQQGDQTACQYYFQAYQQVNNDYGVFSQQFGSGAVAQGPSVGGGLNPLGATHEDRMNSIQNFGSNNTQNWQTHMDEMDRNHQTFLNSLGN